MSQETIQAHQHQKKIRSKEVRKIQRDLQLVKKVVSSSGEATEKSIRGRIEEHNEDVKRHGHMA